MLTAHASLSLEIWCLFILVLFIFTYDDFLLKVCGNLFVWCEQICYFFYKNITFGFTLFWFEAHAYFSGQPAYNDWFISFYSVAFTSLPVIALGVFDKDVSARLCIKVNNRVWIHIILSIPFSSC